LATQEGHQQIIQMLLDADADKDYQLENGATALMIAAQHGHLRATYTLIAAKANINLKASNGMTALMLAERYQFNEIAKLLKKSGAR